MRIVISVVLGLLLAACSTAAPDRFLIEPVSTGQTVKTGADTISVMTVNLPSYAKETGPMTPSVPCAFIWCAVSPT